MNNNTFGLLSHIVKATITTTTKIHKTQDCQTVRRDDS